MPLQRLWLAPSNSNNDNNNSLPNTYRIVRYSDNNNNNMADEEVPFCFLGAAQHDWLEDAVAVPLLPNDDDDDDAPNGVLRGRVDDGELTVVDNDTLVVTVDDGVGDDHAACHYQCWQLLAKNSPLLVVDTEWQRKLSQTPSYQQVCQSYHNQYFDFAKLYQNNEWWMLEDPNDNNDTAANRTNNDADTNRVKTGSERNRERIFSLLQSATEGAAVDNNDQTGAESSRKDTKKKRRLPSLVPSFVNGQTLYDWLNINDTATPETIRRAFRRQQLKHHPSRTIISTTASSSNDNDRMSPYDRTRLAHTILTRFRTEYDECPFGVEDDDTDKYDKLRAFGYIWDQVSKNLT